MEMTLAQIASQVQGQIQGNGRKCITGVAPFETATSSEITFAGSRKFLKRLHETHAGAILVPPDFTEEDDRVIRVKNPQAAFSHVVRIFYPPMPSWSGISPVAHVGQDIKMGTDVAIAPFVVVQNHVTLGDRVTLHPHVVLGDHVSIGNDVEIFPNVTILNGTRIGNRVTIHAGTVIGGDGFGYTPDDGAYHKIPHLGIVQIDDDVEIGAGNTIDRATYGKTWIKNGVKTDNLVHIAHNVTVGENTLLIAQVGIAGSTTIGGQCILAGQVGVSGHITIGDRVTIGPQSGIAGSISDGAIVTGSPEMPHRQWLRVQRSIPMLPEIKKKLGEMEKRLNEIESTLKNTET
ncbi:MAG: UDP-3-O-(3-hydroxymyristoyl)glucosamine N-acyltransferase [Deltaproteobacteria bacterium]|nr:UDP-3-O-(3-hydroxymyristoyl)glucosamine N-acyltransferase [Deltaproteobacteria bacterium]